MSKLPRPSRRRWLNGVVMDSSKHPHRWETPGDAALRAVEEHRPELQVALGCTEFVVLSTKDNQSLGAVREMAIDSNMEYSPTLNRSIYEAGRDIDVASFKILLKDDGPNVYPMQVKVSSSVPSSTGQREYFTVDPSEIPILVSPAHSESFVLIKTNTIYANGDIEHLVLLVVPKENFQERIKSAFGALDKIYDAVNSSSRRIRFIDNYNKTPIPLPASSWTSWDNVFLEDDIKVRIKDDLQFFLNNKKFFQDAGIPYKRGFLICGSPGNGKSSSCRAIATSMPFACFMFDFSDSHMYNEDLSDAFRRAITAAPSVFFLEDIDRLFDAENREKMSTNITLDHLLNCLDGIFVNDGLVVVATANDPKKLDPAILSRPGRFDQVIQIDNPKPDLRRKYLAHLFSKVAKSSQEEFDEGLEFIVKASDGLSMAYLKEIFIATTIASMSDGGIVVTLGAIRKAVERVCNQYNRNGDRKAGF